MFQERYDLEFRARMLNLQAGVDYEPHGHVLSDKPNLREAVDARSCDPIANARARGRIAALFNELPEDPDEPNVDAPRALPAGRGLGLGRFSLC